MVRLTAPAEKRVDRALKALSYGVTKPLRDLMIELVLDVEVDMAIGMLADAMKASMMAQAIVGTGDGPLDIPVHPPLRSIQTCPL